MVGISGFGQAFKANPLRKQRVVVAVGLLLGLGLQCFDLHAALLFRSEEQVDGQQSWSAIRNYGDPADTAYPRESLNDAIAPAEKVRVFLSGDITHADVESAAVMESLLKSGRQKIEGNAVWLASNGGDIDAGMALGRLFRRLGVSTVVGRDDQCLSACVFAFMGGERRRVEGRLGIHRPYFLSTEAAGRQAKFRYMETTLKAFVWEMDFPESLYEAVMRVPPESMQIVSPADLKRFYLEGLSPSTEDRIDAASARRLNLSMLEYLKRKAQAPACAFFAASEGRCEVKVQEAAAPGGMADDPGGMQPGGAAATGQGMKLRAD